MTVKELIKKLQQADPDAPVIILNGTIREVTGTKERLCRLQLSMVSFPVFAVEILANEPDNEGPSGAITEHLAEPPVTFRQWENIKTICYYLEMEPPDIATKRAAQEWLSEHVPKYKKVLEERSLENELLEYFTKTQGQAVTRE